MNDNDENNFSDGDSSGDDTVQMQVSSLDFSNDDSFGLSSEGSFSRKIDRNVIVLAVIIATAVLGLWSMRTLSTSSAQMDAGSTLPESLSIEPIDTSVLERLAVSVPMGLALDGERDPFSMWRPAALTDHQALFEELVEEEPIDVEALCEEWRAEIDRVASLMELKSVLGGGTSRLLVNIEGVLLSKGETFDIAEMNMAFTVESSTARAVMLSSYDTTLDCWHEIELSMDSDG